MSKIRYQISKDDAAEGIFKVLMEVAPKIPLEIEGDDRKTRLREIVQRCCYCGMSWIATGDGQIIGFLLVTTDDYETLQRGNLFLHLLYAGVTKKYRCQGVFSGLIENVKKFNTPLTAVVKHSNQSNMAGRLTKRGFARFES